MHRINDLGNFAPLGLPGFAFGVVYAFHTALCADGSTSATVLDEMITNTETTTCLAVGTTLTSGNPTLFLPTDADSLVIDPAILAELAWFDKIRDWLALVGAITPEQALGFADDEPTYAPLLRAYAARREEPVRHRKPRVK